MQFFKKCHYEEGEFHGGKISSIFPPVNHTCPQVVVEVELVYSTEVDCRIVRRVGCCRPMSVWSHSEGVTCGYVALLVYDGVSYTADSADRGLAHSKPPVLLPPRQRSL